MSTPKILRYGISSHVTAQGLADQIIDLMKEGWEPLGGCSATVVNSGVGTSVYFTQAIAKYDRTQEEQIAEQINDIHTTCVNDIPTFIQSWREYQSYPRMVEQTK